MTVLEGIKKSVEQITGWERPSTQEVAALLRMRRPVTNHFPDDGMIPNHPYWPLVIYRRAVRLPKAFDPAAVFEEVFASNGWGDMWRNGIYDYLHYHSSIHEVLGVARGSARVRFGGNKGRTLRLVEGHVAILPAGTGHQCLSATEDFLVVGAYPPSGTYDECSPTREEHDHGLKAVRKVARPRKDPVYGSKGPLLTAWKA
jgi:uncharacterized protein YjlB